MSSRWLAALNRWYAGHPGLTRIAIAAVFIASVFLIFGWAKYIVAVEPGTVISFGNSAVATTLSLFVVALGSGLAFLLGLIQMLFVPPRRSGLVSIGFGLIPMGLFAATLWFVENVRGIVFD